MIREEIGKAAPRLISARSSSARRAIDAAERAVERDASLSKEQRVAALRALEQARQAVAPGQPSGATRAQEPVRVWQLPPGTLPPVRSRGRTDLFFDGRKGGHFEVETKDGRARIHVAPRLRRTDRSELHYVFDEPLVKPSVRSIEKLRPRAKKIL